MNDTNTNKKEKATHPTIFVIIGITGDLAARKLLPALLDLYVSKELPTKFRIVGFSRRTLSREEFRDNIRSRLHIKPGQYREEDVKHFLDHMTYVQGLFDSNQAYERLSTELSKIDETWGQCSNKLFHLSVPPNLYEGILGSLQSSKLSDPCDDTTGWTRILIEKPFGNDLETAQKLDKLLGKSFKEEQIFRIDHYLAKEALQNILAFRFANSMFEPIWQREFVDKIHIKLFEKSGIDGRGAFYDPIGAIKDVGQNHMLAMLALIAMDRPGSFSAKDIRKGRAKVLADLVKFTPAKLKAKALKGQYEGYTAEMGVKENSETETYFRLEVGLGSKRWKGVPFYLESGKALAESKTEIDVYFKNLKARTGKGMNDDLDRQNILTFRIQPDEGIKIRFFVKTPGYEFHTEPKPLKFKYSDSIAFHDIPSDYRRLIYDAIVGDQTLFASTEEITSSWKFIASLMSGWKKITLIKYPKGAKEV